MGLSGPQSASATHPVQRLLSTSHTGSAPSQSPLSKHSTHMFWLISHTGASEGQERQAPAGTLPSTAMQSLSPLRTLPAGHCGSPQAAIPNKATISAMAAKVPWAVFCHVERCSVSAEVGTVGAMNVIGSALLMVGVQLLGRCRPDPRSVVATAQQFRSWSATGQPVSRELSPRRGDKQKFTVQSWERCRAPVRDGE